MMNEEDIRKLFSEFGQIEDCNILRENGKSRGNFFINFIWSIVFVTYGCLSFSNAWGF